MADQDDPYANIAKPVADDPYASVAKDEPPFTPGQTSMLHDLGQAGIGAAKGLAHTLTAPFTPAKSELPHLKPSNSAQSVGHGLEQAGEFLVPGAGEEAIGAKAGKLAPLAKAGYNALMSGGLNKIQGGSFGTGAALGGSGSAIGQGLAAAAPKMAESAIGITKADRGFGKSPGQAIINETKGIRPETVAASAQQKIGELNPEIELAASKSHNFANLQPARDVVEGAQSKAIARNAAGTHAQLEPMRQHLNTRFNTSQTIPPVVSPPELLNLRRGFNDEFGQWNPETLPGVAGTGRQAYHALTNEFHQAVPGTEDLDERISNLIPVVKRAESTSRNAPLIQRAAGRFGAHTGALVGAGLGASEGRREGGIPGMIVGGTAGLLAPELIATPEGRMIAARSAASPTVRNMFGAPVKGGLLQLDREDKQ